MTLAQRIAAALGEEAEAIADLGMQRVTADGRNGLTVDFTFDENGEDCVVLFFGRDILGCPFYLSKAKLEDDQDQFTGLCASAGIEVKNPVNWKIERSLER